MKRNNWLVAGGLLSAAAALLHIAIIVGGPDWYRFFGAGERLARLAETGSPVPAFTTMGIAVVLSLWAAYAFSGAGIIGRLPLLRTALILISAVYLLRGLVLFPALLLKPQLVDGFTVWSSIIVLVFGVAYALGTWAAWPNLARRAVGASGPA